MDWFLGISFGIIAGLLFFGAVVTIFDKEGRDGSGR